MTRATVAIAAFVWIACTARSPDPGKPTSTTADSASASTTQIDAAPSEQAVDTCAELCKWSRCPELVSPQLCLDECKLGMQYLPRMPGCLGALQQRSDCLYGLDCAGLRSHMEAIQRNGTSQCLAKEKLFVMYCSGQPDMGACLRNCELDRTCGVETRATDECALECFDRLVDRTLRHGLECRGATGVVAICQSFQSCDKRRAIREGRPDRPCQQEIADMNRKCGL